MNRLLSGLLIALLAASGPAAAQDSAATDSEAAEAPGADAGIGLTIAEPEQSGPEVGQTYVRETFTDWEFRCVKSEDGNDPCQLYQLLDDETGNSVAEITMFAIPPGNRAVAGATVITPLETLLTEQVRLSVDGANSRRYPFNFCTRLGCIARLGFTEEEVAQFRRGVKAELTIVPAGAPDKTVTVDISLAGFTAGFAALQALQTAE